MWAGFVNLFSFPSVKHMMLWCCQQNPLYQYMESFLQYQMESRYVRRIYISCC